jgi:hypothetical protein
MLKHVKTIPSLWKLDFWRGKMNATSSTKMISKRGSRKT